MPIFDYHCIDCDKVFDMLLKAGSETQPACTACSSTNTEKLVSAPAPQLASLALRKRSRARAAAEGQLTHFSGKEVSTFKG